MKEKGGFTYIMMSLSGVIYIGVTSNLLSRAWQHKNNVYHGFTNLYRCHKLVYYECYEDIESVIQREKQLKDWKRKWKLELIEANNPTFKDLYLEIEEGKYQFFEQGCSIHRS